MAKIGLLSDSHGRDKRTREAVETLISRDVDVVIHLGDVGNLEVIDALIESIDGDGNLVPPVHMVFGNVDWDYVSMERYASSMGITVGHPVGRVEIDGKTLVYQHGHEDQFMREALEERVAFLCHGHTHEARNEKLGSTRVINPGALFRAAEYSIAILDTETEDVEFITVD